MTDQQHVPHPTLADICRELVEIKGMVKALLKRNNPPPGPLPRRGVKQSAKTRRYIGEIIIPKLKQIGVQSKAEAERMLYGFCLIDKFEKLTQAQAEAFYIHVQENSEDPPGLWRLKPTPATNGRDTEHRVPTQQTTP